MAQQQNNQRKVALGYIRQSQTKGVNDTTSLERQEALLRAKASELGLKLEIYTDAHGHRSATSEEGRPKWQKLKQRLPDEDVAALITTDLSRLHRNARNALTLLDDLIEYEVELILVNYGGDHLDQSTKELRFALSLQAIMDEFVARNTSEKAKAAHAYRKSQGKTSGMPPFGTRRKKS